MILAKSELHLILRQSVENLDNQPNNRTKKGSFIGTIFGLVTGITMLGAFCALVFVSVGFVKYTNMVKSHENETVTADAVVVFTGGKDRIQTANQLLMERKAKRMLISGVNAVSSRKAVGKTVGIDPQILKCCVEFDYQAKDTHGNAKHTANWIRENKFSNVIVVTSDYHMPRGLLELRENLPEVNLQPHTVTYAPLQRTDWYKEPETLKLLFSEYSKFLATSMLIDYTKMDQKITKFASANGF